MADSVQPQRRQLTSSPVPGILQAGTLEWVAISFSSTWKWKVKVKLLSCVWLCVTPRTAAYQAPPSMRFSRQRYWSGFPLPSLKKSLVFTILLFSSIFYTVPLKRLSYFFLLFAGTLHSDAYIFPFLLCFSPLFFSQLFVRPPQTAILLFCISFPWGWSWSLSLYNVMNLIP